MYFIDQTRDRNFIRDEVSKIKVAEFQPKSGVKIYENDEQLKADTEQQQDHSGRKNTDGNTIVNEIRDRLPKHEQIRDIKIRAHEFEKDDDKNFHIGLYCCLQRIYEQKIMKFKQQNEVKSNVLPDVLSQQSRQQQRWLQDLYALKFTNSFKVKKRLNHIKMHLLIWLYHSLPSRNQYHQANVKYVYHEQYFRAKFFHCSILRRNLHYGIDLKLTKTWH